MPLRMHILLYALECVPFNNRDLKSLDFIVNRLLMKLFKSSNIDMINECRNSFAFQLPCSEKLQRRKENFNMKIMHCCGILGYFKLHRSN